MQARYRAPPSDALVMVWLDDLCAVYHRTSGITHLLASPAPEILDLLADRPVGRTALLAALAQRFDLADPDADALTARLDELLAAGLVERS